MEPVITKKVVLARFIKSETCMWKEGTCSMIRCAQRRFKAVCTSAQSDYKLSFPSEETLDPRLPLDRSSKTDQTAQNSFGGVLSCMIQCSM